MHGHSGDGPRVPLFKDKTAPRNEKEMFDVILKMKEHASYCISGGIHRNKRPRYFAERMSLAYAILLDNTLQAIKEAVSNASKEEADDYFVVVLSDANLNQYNIRPEDLRQGRPCVVAFYENHREYSIKSLVMHVFSSDCGSQSECMHRLYWHRA